MNREKFLLFLLSGIFLFQAGWFTFALVWCANNGGPATCSKIGERYEQTAAAMTATVLALMVGDKRP